MQEKSKGNPLFISQLSDLMKRNNLSQSDLMRMTNISQATISSYLLGRTTPKSDELCRLSTAFGVTMDWLWAGTDLDTQIDDLASARQEITRLKNKLKSATQTLEGAYKLALEALKLEE